ncbi:hypothetical protein [Singulisphaera sp. PoT]|uniref:hypothetical protein n=1 Tax=Singulisphaera sp. PoT TaxID=3411797 RepID=UPI003BF4F31F
MSFSQATVGDVSLSRDGAELFVSWTGTLPADSVYQVYVDNVLAWWGPQASTHLPWPSKQVRVSVGTCGTEEAATDFSVSLPALDANTRDLDWEGGTYLASDIAGFHVYGSAAPGGVVDYSTLLDDIPAYPGGLVTDGYGMGGYGHGGYGRSAAFYSWTTPELSSGTWQFAVAAYDQAGNELSSPRTVSVTISAPPRPPAADARGRRLSYAYDPATHKVTLNWLASPG